jgi:hypothetical protein
MQSQVGGISVLLSMNEIEAELSYAYLHAVAARAGFACEIAGGRAIGPASTRGFISRSGLHPPHHSPTSPWKSSSKQPVGIRFFKKITIHTG